MTCFSTNIVYVLKVNCYYYNVNIEEYVYLS